MTTKKTYHLVLFVLLSLIAIPAASGLLTGNYLWYSALNIKGIQLFLIFVILFFEFRLAEKKWLQILIGVLGGAVVLGYIFKLMHWQGTKEIFLLGALLFPITVLIKGVVNKGRGLLEFVVSLYISAHATYMIYPSLDGVWKIDAGVLFAAWAASALLFFWGMLKKDRAY